MKPSWASLTILVLPCHVFNAIIEWTLCKTRLYASFHNCPLRLDSWLLSDVFVRPPWLRSWRKEIVYLMSALGCSQMQTVLVHSSAEQARKEEGRWWGNKEATDKNKKAWHVHGSCDVSFFSVYLFLWCYMFILPQPVFWLINIKTSLRACK